jgi:hypothetical protein
VVAESSGDWARGSGSKVSMKHNPVRSKDEYRSIFESGSRPPVMEADGIENWLENAENVFCLTPYIVTTSPMTPVLFPM